MLRQALNWLQQRVLQPATSAFERRGGGYAAAGLKSLLQTRKLWLPGLHADGVGWSD